MSESSEKMWIRIGACSRLAVEVMGNSIGPKDSDYSDHSVRTLYRSLRITFSREIQHPITNNREVNRYGGGHRGRELVSKIGPLPESVMALSNASLLALILHPQKEFIASEDYENKTRADVRGV